MCYSCARYFYYNIISKIPKVIIFHNNSFNFLDEWKLFSNNSDSPPIEIKIKLNNILSGSYLVRVDAFRL